MNIRKRVGRDRGSETAAGGARGEGEEIRVEGKRVDERGGRESSRKDARIKGERGMRGR